MKLLIKENKDLIKQQENFIQNTFNEIIEIAVVKDTEPFFDILTSRIIENNKFKKMMT